MRCVIHKWPCRVAARAILPSYPTYIASIVTKTGFIANNWVTHRVSASFWPGLVV